ncbi:hypothetical protein YC2023_028492 [Brassica napus]
MSFSLFLSFLKLSISSFPFSLTFFCPISSAKILSFFVLFSYMFLFSNNN